MNVINSRQNTNCHGLVVGRELVVGVVKRILIKRGHLSEAPDASLPNAWLQSSAHLTCVNQPIWRHQPGHVQLRPGNVERVDRRRRRAAYTYRKRNRTERSGGDNASLIGLFERLIEKFPAMTQIALNPCRNSEKFFLSELKFRSFCVTLRHF